jgi:hypothetical protein
VKAYSLILIAFVIASADAPLAHDGIISHSFVVSSMGPMRRLYDMVVRLKLTWTAYETVALMAFTKLEASSERKRQSSQVSISQHLRPTEETSPPGSICHIGV